MVKKFSWIAIMVVLAASLGLNVYFKINIDRQKSYTVHGTYVAVDNEGEYTYLVLQEDDGYCMYSQRRGIIEKGSYKRSDSSLVLKTDGYKKDAICEKDIVYFADAENVVTFRKESELEIFIKLDK